MKVEYAHGDRPMEGVVFNSGLIIRDASVLTTLTVLYPNVYLPYVGTMLYTKDVFKRNILPWDNKWKLLFHESVLTRLPKPGGGNQVVELNKNIIDEDPVLWDFGVPIEELRCLGRAFLPLGWAAVLHLCRDDVSLPRIFDSRRGMFSRNNLVLLESFSLFKYLLPKLNPLEPEEILELQQKLKDTREGFAMHLQKLSKSMDGLIKSGAKLPELSREAQALIETELIPDYKEFRRRLQAEEKGNWRKALDVAGRIMEIDAAPWTLKFWGLLLKALGMSAIDTGADQKERLSNRYQAYEFMRVVEDTGRRL